MNPFINIAVTAAHAGGDLIMRYLNRVDQLKISAKGNSDFVSEVDRGAEAEIIRIEEEEILGDGSHTLIFFAILTSAHSLRSFTTLTTECSLRSLLAAQT